MQWSLTVWCMRHACCVRRDGDDHGGGDKQCDCVCACVRLLCFIWHSGLFATLIFGSIGYNGYAKGSGKY